MKKIILAVLVLGGCVVSAQVHNGNAQFGTQAAIDTFGIYTTITGKLQVFGSDIKDLSPLGSVDSVLGKLEILQTDSLTSFDGLNVSYVGNNLYIADNKALLDIDGLSSLEYIGKDLVIINNDTLQNIDGLSNVDTIKRHVYIGEEGWNNPSVVAPNPYLSSFCGVSNAIIGGGYNTANDYYVSNNAFNPTVSDIQGGNCFMPLVYTGNLQLGSQADVDAVSQQYVTVTGKLQVYGSDVVDLSPLMNIDSVYGKLEILMTDSLVSLAGLSVKYVGSNLYIVDNKVLENLNGLESVSFVGKDLVILGNDSLVNLNGLIGLQTIDQNIYIGEEGWKAPPVAHGNISLEDLCGLSDVLNNGGFNTSNDYFVSNNAYNPTLVDFTNSNCALNHVGITETRLNDFGVSYKEGNLYIFPNEGLKGNKFSVHIYQINGQEVFVNEALMINNEVRIDKKLNRGIYVLGLRLNGSVWTQKFIVY